MRGFAEQSLFWSLAERAWRLWSRRGPVATEPLASSLPLPASSFCQARCFSAGPVSTLLLATPAEEMRGLSGWMVLLVVGSWFRLRAKGAVPLPGFYPFGPAQGDAATPQQDDGGSGLQPIAVKFPFFGATHTALYVSSRPVPSGLRKVQAPHLLISAVP